MIPLAEARGEGRGEPRVLYVSPLDVTAQNGMLQRQHQILAFLARRHPGRLDLVTLHSAPRLVSRWLARIGVGARVLTGPFFSLARWNALAWYLGNSLACNRLGWTSNFAFPLATPLPAPLIERYHLIVCFYPWAFLLLDLRRAGSRVAVDLGDVMADRHQRIGVRRWISLASDQERAILQGAPRCLAISDEDRGEFHRLYGRLLPVVPFLPPQHRELLELALVSRTPRAGFFAARGHQSEQALEVLSTDRFLDTLAASGIGLVLAGGICERIGAAAAARLRRKGVRLAGRVPEVWDFYSQVGTVLNPAGPSTGMKIKSVEALLAGRSLVTTRYGADASLGDVFGPQIVSVDWPVEPAALARVTARTALAACEADQATAPSNGVRHAAALRWVALAEAALTAVLIP
jgi:hypothetical protein